MICESQSKKIQIFFHLNFTCKSCVRVTIAMKKQHGESNTGKMVFILLTPSYNSSLSKAVMVGTQAGHKPGGWS